MPRGKDMLLVTEAFLEDVLGVTDGVRTHNHWSHNPELCRVELRSPYGFAYSQYSERPGYCQ